MSSARTKLLQKLSPERAHQVFALIKDLAELEALESTEDLKGARASLAETKSGSSTLPYEQLRREACLEN